MQNTVMISRSKAKKRQSAFLSFAVSQGLVKGILLTIFLGGLIAYLTFTYAIIPKDAELDQKARDYIALRDKNQASKQIQSTYNEFIEEFRQALKNYAEVRPLVPEEVEVSNVLTAVQELASKDGVKLTIFSGQVSATPPAKPASPGSEKTTTIAAKLNERVVPCQVIGSYQNVARFFADVANYQRIIHVSEIDVTSLVKRQQSVNFILTAFYAPSPTDLPEVPQELKNEVVDPTSGRKTH
jgi:Tfp pilus assembly protein PilO